MNLDEIWWGRVPSVPGVINAYVQSSIPATSMYFRCHNNHLPKAFIVSKLYLIICILSWSSYTVLYKADNISIILNHHVNLSYSIQSEHHFRHINVSCAEQRSLTGRQCTRVATSGT